MFMPADNYNLGPLSFSLAAFPETLHWLVIWLPFLLIYNDYRAKLLANYIEFHGINLKFSAILYELMIKDLQLVASINIHFLALPYISSFSFVESVDTSSLYSEAVLYGVLLHHKSLIMLTFQGMWH